MSLMPLEVIFEKEIDLKIKTIADMHRTLICIRHTPQKLLRKRSKYCIQNTLNNQSIIPPLPATESCDEAQTGLELLISCLHLSNAGLTDVHHHAWLEGFDYIKVI